MIPPHDLDLERAVVGGIVAGWTADDPDLAPEHFYDPRHAAILLAYRRLARHDRSFAYRQRYGRPDVRLTVEGLAEELVAVAPDDNGQLCAHAEAIATSAPVATRADVDRVIDLATRRRRLAEIEAEKAVLLGEGTW